MQNSLPSVIKGTLIFSDISFLQSACYSRVSEFVESPLHILNNQNEIKKRMNPVIRPSQVISIRFLISIDYPFSNKSNKKTKSFQTLCFPEEEALYFLTPRHL